MRISPATIVPLEPTPNSRRQNNSPLLQRDAAEESKRKRNAINRNICLMMLRRGYFKDTKNKCSAGEHTNTNNHGSSCTDISLVSSEKVEKADGDWLLSKIDKKLGWRSEKIRVSILRVSSVGCNELTAILEDALKNKVLHVVLVAASDAAFTNQCRPVVEKRKNDITCELFAQNRFLMDLCLLWAKYFVVPVSRERAIYESLGILKSSIIEAPDVFKSVTYNQQWLESLPENKEDNYENRKKHLNSRKIDDSSLSVLDQSFKKNHCMVVTDPLAQYFGFQIGQLIMGVSFMKTDFSGIVPSDFYMNS